MRIHQQSRTSALVHTLRQTGEQHGNASLGMAAGMAVLRLNAEAGALTDMAQLVTLILGSIAHSRSMSTGRLELFGIIL